MSLPPFSRSPSFPSPTNQQLNTRYTHTEPVGLERIREALEANDWTANDDDGLDSLLLDEDDEGEQETGFDAEAAELEREMLGLKMAIHGGRGSGLGEEEGGDDDDGEDEEFQVEQLESVMLRMQALKGLSLSLYRDILLTY